MRLAASLLLLLTLSGDASASPATAPATAPGMAERCARLSDEWRQRFGDEKLDVLIAPPFVIAGDGGPERLARYRDRTILAAADALAATFFHKPPERPILILLFESDASYRRLARKWFDDEPDTPFGYFRADNVMVMNVATGTGTLVHEMVHALIRPDFPGVPDWLNEGLGSLYEQCTINASDIRGLPNWRLPALQQAIRQNKLRPIRELLDDRHFYDDARVGLNYAQSRYLLMYLQEQGILRDFYAKARDRHPDDPTGSASLVELVGPDLAAFERRWRRWVLDLRFPTSP